MVQTPLDRFLRMKSDSAPGADERSNQNPHDGYLRMRKFRSQAQVLLQAFVKVGIGEGIPAVGSGCRGGRVWDSSGGQHPSQPEPTRRALTRGLAGVDRARNEPPILCKPPRYGGDTEETTVITYHAACQFPLKNVVGENGTNPLLLRAQGLDRYQPASQPGRMGVP